MTTSINIDICDPKDQLNLYGYDRYFKLFKDLFEKKKLPNAILLKGPKGSGKSTFAHHFINYLLSLNNDVKYSLENYEINQNSSTSKLISNLTHPNFFLLEKNLSNENIKIDQIRNLIKFLSKSVYLNNLKIVLIDDSECLNSFSSNALLKSLEEPLNNTFFFIIHHDTSHIINTIKSRCVTFKLHFNLLEKKIIFNKILKKYRLDLENINLDKFLYFNSAGNFLKYLISLKDSNLKISEDTLACVLFLIDKYKSKKDNELLYLITLSIENLYNEMILKNSGRVNYYSLEKDKILYLIRNGNKFNLDSKNLIFTIEGILKNEK